MLFLQDDDCRFVKPGRVDSIDYPDVSVYEMFRRRAEAEPEQIASEFMGKRTDYRRLLSQVDRLSASLNGMGLAKGERVLVCLPNCTQAAIAFYAISRCGAISELIHPLSAKAEMADYISGSGARIAFVLDLFADKFLDYIGNTTLESMIVVSAKEYLTPVGKAYYHLKAGRKLPDFEVAGVHLFPDLLKQAGTSEEVVTRGGDPALILHTGGTSGKAKGALLSNLNMNATALQTVAACGNVDRNHRKMLSVMPIFHGFGLCIGMHMMLIEGGTCVFVPRFTPDSYAKLIVKKKPNYIAGVPTLFEHMIRSKSLKKADLSSLKGIFVGGDSLTESLRERMEAFFRERNCETPVREGYGLTECVTASCLTPRGEHRPGSVGLPFADTLYKIVEAETENEAPVGTEGEICISGPSVMMGYVGDPEETQKTLRIHGDCRVWLHTGDLGSMDGDGFVYFKQRLKRVIISSGYNIYPSQIENILDSHPMVSCSCVVGVPDDIRRESAKAYIVLKKKAEDMETVVDEIKGYCKDHLALYSVPREFEVLDELPRTLIGKVAYSALQNRG
ncbi:MAG: AMP-binding protein [Candidatus Methanomethylophilaceae archaeon]|nr:AMP-binding protein [Candidatus Methanomethylophilaceae archaeon]